MSTNVKIESIGLGMVARIVGRIVEWVLLAIGCFSVYRYATSHFPEASKVVGWSYHAALYLFCFWILIVRPFRDGFRVSSSDSAVHLDDSKKLAQQSGASDRDNAPV